MPNSCVLVLLLLRFQMWWHHFSFLFFPNIHGCPLIHLSACLSVCVSSADININSPPTNPTCKKKKAQNKIRSGCVFMQKLPQGLCCCVKKQKTKLETLAGLDLDGDFFIPVLSAAICCCVALSSYDAQSQYGLTSSLGY